jgi:hypothetical protein
MVIEAKNLPFINDIQGLELPAHNALAARPAIFASKTYQAFSQFFSNEVNRD